MESKSRITVRDSVIDDDIPNALLYIDNSNMFEEAKKHSGRKKQYRNEIQDVACRIDIGKLIAKALGNRRLLVGKLYGSEPPALDSVWEAIRKKRVSVQTFQRSKITRKEKECDQSLTANAVEDIIIEKEDAGENRVVILFSGDRDLLSTVRVGIKYGYRVEIWAFKVSTNKAVINYAREIPDKLVINYIDNIFDEVTFTKVVWGQKIPRERSLVASVKIPPEYNKTQIFKQFVKEAGKIFRLPMMGRYINNHQQIVLVPCVKELYTPPPRGGSAQAPNRNFNFYTDVQPWVHLLLEYFKNICTEIQPWNEFIASCKVTDNPTFLSSTRFQKLKNEDDDDDQETEDGNDDEVEDYEEVDDFEVLVGTESGISFEDFDSNDFFDAHHENMSDEDDGEDVFFPILGKAVKRKSQRYSVPCKHRFWCTHGRKCAYKHTDQEREFFKEHTDVKTRKYYKIKPCYRNVNNTCKYMGKSYLCPYAHNVEESRCLCCGGKGNGIHWMDQCPCSSENAS